ncbi:MAG: OpgC domain-containing protein, partial [Hyphomicrobiaceae bacterium]|nr:OpgC domain-containing protein [Hyphomicrobiaceae bacterium]
LIPFVVWLGRYGRLPVAAFVLSLYAVGTSGIIDFGGDPLAPEVWFFNPFAWQLVFFTGFAFMRGWIPAPPVDHRLIIAALLVVVVLIPLANPLLVESSDSLRAGNQALWPLVDKTHFRPLRLVHFLAVAYLAWVVAGEGGRRLTGPVVAVCCKVGQQALGVFMAGIVLSLAAGIVLDLTGRNFVLATAVNLAGCALLVAVAYMADYFKRQPWLALNGTGIRPARGAAGPSPAAAQSHALASRPDEAMADFGPGSRIVPAE